MVRLHLRPHRGNSTRAYPFTGYLGVTPVTVHGQLQTVLEEDGIPLEASSVVVRVACYEGNISGPGSQSSSAVRRLYEVTETVWEAPDGSDYASLGDLERSFRLTIPVDAKEQGAVSTLSFKTWRIWWLVEAVIYHRPAPLFGSTLRKSHPLLLVDHSAPTMQAPPLWRGPNERVLLCKASVQSPIYGAGDSFSLRLDLRKRSAAPRYAVKRITVELRRVMTRRGASLEGHDASEDELPITPPYEEPNDDPSAALLSQVTDSYFNAMSTASSKREESTLLAITDEDISFESDGRWSGIFEGTLPRNRTTYHYSLGETVDNDCLSIKCFMHVRITPVDRSHPVLEMQPTEIQLSSISAEERGAAAAESKRISILQDAERRLFEPDGDGTCRATKKRLSTSSESAASRRRMSDAESQLEDIFLPRQRFRSTDVAMDSRPRKSRDPSPVSSPAPPLQKLHLPAFNRARFNSVDFGRSTVSPVLEDDGTPRLNAPTPRLASAPTPRLASAPSLLRRPVTPPDDEPSTELFQKFAGFNFADTVPLPELSPPLSPAYSMTSSSSGSKKDMAMSAPLSPRTASSRAIPTLAYQRDGLSPTQSLMQLPLDPPPIVRIHSHEATEAPKGRRGSGGLRALFRRSPSKA